MEPTRDHDEIRRWAESHDGIPAEVIPFVFDHQPSVLQFLFGKAKQGTPELRPISWEDFFARFDLLELTLCFDEEFAIYEILLPEKPAHTALPN